MSLIFCVDFNICQIALTLVVWTSFVGVQTWRYVLKREGIVEEEEDDNRSGIVQALIVIYYIITIAYLCFGVGLCLKLV